MAIIAAGLGMGYLVYGANDQTPHRRAYLLVLLIVVLAGIGGQRALYALATRNTAEALS